MLLQRTLHKEHTFSRTLHREHTFIFKDEFSSLTPIWFIEIIGQLRVILK
jgi:hypothetical protein